MAELDGLDGPQWHRLARDYPAMPVPSRVEVAAFAHLRMAIAHLVAADPDPVVRRALAGNPFIAGTDVHRRLLEDSDVSFVAAAAQWHSSSLGDLRRALLRRKDRAGQQAIGNASLTRSQLLVWAPLARRHAHRKQERLAEAMRRKHLSPRE